MNLGPPINVSPLFPAEQTRLLTALHDLDATQWKAPTICTGWTVHDLTAHILGDHLGRLSGARDSYRTSGPLKNEPFPDFIHRINQEWVVATRRLSPTVLLDLLTDASKQIVEFWRTADPDATSIPVSWAGPDPAPMWLDMARDYTEYWVHQQQIRAAVGMPPLDDPAPVVDIFMRALPFTLRDSTADEVEYEVFGVGTWSCARGADGWTLRPGMAAKPAATVRTDPDTFWRLCTRNIDRATAQVVTEGDRAVAETMLTMVSIII
ncbi:maleylpyruvate isomerase family mycothiol-dependent enzyme [Fodinicola acaciae]|uniref:maleylpyruvate isomerase family mycothiol-dependent enzyme n=1 Tax=Fodinicola acaciae TaxID=2681555 RepID=UPI0013D5FC02|nr:maleylpyruvate isomerase family mycothiol-dependent enzyme [Fodinicola acaciae]